MNYPLLFLGGPTGSGKSRLAISVSAHFPCEIINADSRQVYRDLIVGTNQPSSHDRESVPHHLFGFLDPESRFSAAEYEKLASPIVREILARGRLPLIVGGTGFYMKALLRGVWPAPPANSTLRERFHEMERRRGKTFLHRILQRVDPPSAALVPSGDVYRVMRALEIFFQGGIRASDLRVHQTERFPALKFYVAPAREQLREMLRLRMEEMFQRNWVAEVSNLLEKYPQFETLPAAHSIGYREVIRYVKGELELESCKTLILRETLQYAKRQLTWFRNQDGFQCLPEGDELHKITESVLQLKANS